MSTAAATAIAAVSRRPPSCRCRSATYLVYGADAQFNQPHEMDQERRDQLDQYEDVHAVGWLGGCCHKLSLSGSCSF